MPALPTPGGSTDTWGDELNEFLEVAHNANGTINAAVMVGYPHECRSVANTGITNIFAVRVWVPFRATFSKYLFYCGNATGNMDLGIYTAAGVAVTREGSFAIPGTGRQTRTITGGPVTLAPGEYIIAYQKNDGTSTFGIIAATGCDLIAYTPTNTFPLPSTMTLTVGGTGICLALLP